jgi:methylenetetrahydrofolate dehydrogenase (NADP+) / methenyltetrahydrofolate cyclohydrolase
MPALVIDPGQVAAEFKHRLRQEISALPEQLLLVGLIAGEHSAAHTYAEYTRRGCEDVGVNFELRNVPRFEMEAAIHAANADPAVHGILVYYPVFGTEQDRYVRDSVEPSKDIEGLHSFWSRCLYENRRFYDEARRKKSILPCTPLAILKLLERCSVMDPKAPQPLAGRQVCIFNRSEVVGRPLASMLANDGADVLSFDVDGVQAFLPSGVGQAHSVTDTQVDRSTALGSADIVITGVPSRSFPRIGPGEIRAGAVCVNFSTFANFEPEITEKAGIFIPRVGPMTVTMALRNTLRLYQNANL